MGAGTQTDSDSDQFTRHTTRPSPTARGSCRTWGSAPSELCRCLPLR